MPQYEPEDPIVGQPVQQSCPTPQIWPSHETPHTTPPFEPLPTPPVPEPDPEPEPDPIHWPLQQTGARAGHWFLHAAQLLGSDERSTQPESQQLKPPVHAAPPIALGHLQTPPSHTLLLVQTGLQVVGTHAPSRQACPIGQTLPHSLQLFGSVARMTQPDDGQHVRPTLHAAPPLHLHWPESHASPALHSKPHDPQLRASLLVLAHEPPQQVSVSPHALVPLPQRHAPPTQLSPTRHCLPH